ncbi:MAG: lysophospholipid acyltransferase family protein [Kiritimatiellia bacterium]|jgi:lauroyl/myristoyl acyltransferase
MRHKPKHYVEYVLMRAIGGLVGILPYRVALALGWGLAWLGFYVLRFRVSAAEKRIREIFGSNLSPREVRRIAWGSWRNFIFSCVDLLRIPVMSSEWIMCAVSEDGVDKLRAQVSTGQGGIIATIHMGAWEMAALACLSFKLPLFSIAARQKNLLTDAYMNRLRAKTGFETILRDRHAVKEIVRRIKSGKLLAILPDVRSPTPALSVQFLGHTANIAAGMGAIARWANAPIFPCVITRVGWGRHVYRVFDPVWPNMELDKKADVLRMTQAVFDVFDRCVQAEPEQWFWYNKRWLFDPLPAAAAPSADDAPPVQE